MNNTKRGEWENANVLARLKHFRVNKPWKSTTGTFQPIWFSIFQWKEIIRRSWDSYSLAARSILCFPYPWQSSSWRWNPVKEISPRWARWTLAYLWIQCWFTDYEYTFCIFAFSDILSISGLLCSLHWWEDSLGEKRRSREKRSNILIENRQYMLK